QPGRVPQPWAGSSLGSSLGNPSGDEEAAGLKLSRGRDCQEAECHLRPDRALPDAGAPAAGPAGCGACQAGDHGRAEQHRREHTPSRSVSASPPESLQDEERAGGAGLKRKREEKDQPGHYDSDGDKSDYNLVVDEDPPSEPGSPGRAPSSRLLLARREMPGSPASIASSRSTTPLKPKDQSLTDPPASAPTSKPSSSSPPCDSLTPGPGPSSATLLRQPPTKAPATDTITLRSPLSMSSPYTSFGMVPHATLNGDLQPPSMYVGIHLSPQVSSAVMYGQSPMVAFESHPHLRASTISSSLSTIPGGKP
uniref:Uncharacterized protein n=1 Tax=Falco tinnunculus TaxID=100819 RepID=A0A8C4TZ91_FALTI